MDNKYYEQFLIMQATIEANTQSIIQANMKETDKKLTKPTGDLSMLTSTITSMMDQTKKFEILTILEGYIKYSGSYHCGPV